MVMVLEMYVIQILMETVRIMKRTPSREIQKRIPIQTMTVLVIMKIPTMMVMVRAMKKRKLQDLILMILMIKLQIPMVTVHQT